MAGWEGEGGVGGWNQINLWAYPLTTLTVRRKVAEDRNIMLTIHYQNYMVPWLRDVFKNLNYVYLYPILKSHLLADELQLLNTLNTLSIMRYSARLLISLWAIKLISRLYG